MLALPRGRGRDWAHNARSPLRQAGLNVQRMQHADRQVPKKEKGKGPQIRRRELRKGMKKKNAGAVIFQVFCLS